MRDPPMATEPSLVRSSGLRAAIFAGGGLSATLFLPLGAGSSANAIPAAHTAPSIKRKTTFMKPSFPLDRHPPWVRLTDGLARTKNTDLLADGATAYPRLPSVSYPAGREHRWAVNFTVTAECQQDSGSHVIRRAARVAYSAPNDGFPRAP